ncbi:hypothetical protein J31TS4_03010 [Paenibacillus sp. J31TS4]|uniref:hypothetical protein n=1 Tax=Paenibacillus sp. J31TS4 TaxID=2807195 RepID=UPI001B2BCF80|nr:hypothetical protein [Paenibacillus sp. J31TS4]GIP37021.1 hypothetical protein J31TS4_03010 [Paenibacillus sp. J31TS4]
MEPKRKDESQYSGLPLMMIVALYFLSQHWLVNLFLDWGLDPDKSDYLVIAILTVYAIGYYTCYFQNKLKK